ncbi:MAG: TetR/AcrR family transcriptional regulator, lmrAB and yxaGH operons repressor [Pseudonocardiales bacterium]|jgi:TetR/AcrR family transcriptional repressor of lmrAB and yxaGH operons|nr:TetR/AcrR family transcriptional regulator, lmrAB and yxaGH operons repressor [Pseudonocardiales bacterium]MDT7669909.1 TetR/AcrR family transcriptional regulator, lmrAB and yxaGH operons repressor [Pseudonocardiales bacterium]MDT7773810.1 TetR/AcrR family transcriptional regulator, lmrAB and yxaGH operons repressor [Pseudonocardiales bacterium]
MPRDTKQRMVEAAAGLLRSRGLAAMSFTDVLAVSGAARGVI